MSANFNYQGASKLFKIIKFNLKNKLKGEKKTTFKIDLRIFINPFKNHKKNAF